MSQIKGPLQIISIIIPLFNESSNLDELYSRINSVINNLKRNFEVIFVDDGSTDDSYEKIINLKKDYPNIAIIRHRINHGKSLALMQGFDLARGEIAITLDADLQDQPEMIPRFIEKLEHGHDLANGWRKERKDTLPKRFVSKIFNSVVSRIFSFKIHDINCGFKAFKYPTYKRLELKGDLHRFIPLMVKALGYKVGEVPVVHSERKHGQSKYRLFRHRGLLDIIAFSARHTTQWRPFHVFCEVAAFFWGAAIIFLLLWILNKESFPDLFNGLVAVFGSWFMLVGTLLPLFGFFLEIQTDKFQSPEDRKQLIAETIYAETSSI
jgi:glycosyltransferase involved in cell wall biosynthesis